MTNPVFCEYFWSPKTSVGIIVSVMKRANFLYETICYPATEESYSEAEALQIAANWIEKLNQQGYTWTPELKNQQEATMWRSH